MIKIVHYLIENVAFLGILGFLLITVPMIGIMAAHERSKGD